MDPDREAGEGRADVVVHDYTDRHIAIFEVKCPDMKKKTVQDAIRQIVEKKYEASFPDFTIISYGIASRRRDAMRKRRAGEHFLAFPSDSADNT